MTPNQPTQTNIGMKLVCKDGDDDAQASKTHGGFLALISNESVDRDGEIVDAGAFEPLPKSIPLLVSHDWNAMPIGRGVPFYDGKDLKLDVFYGSSPEAQAHRALINEKIVTEFSVGFANANYEMDSDDGRWHLRKGELLETSLVSVPSNRDTTVLAAKMAAEKTTTEVDDPETSSTGVESVELTPVCELSVEAALFAADSTLFINTLE